MRIGVVFDLDGTVYLGNKLLPGVRDAISQLRTLGVQRSFVTNNSSRSPRYYEEKLRGMRIGVEDGAVVSSADAAVTALGEAGIGRVYPVLTQECQSYLQSAGIEFCRDQEAEAVLVGFDTEVNYEKLKHASHAISSGLPFLATHPDIVCPVETGYVPDCGAICRLLEASTGVSPTFFGKPQRYLLETAAHRMGVPMEKVVVVGDRPHTDVRMGNSCGAATILVKTGEGGSYDVHALPPTDRPVLTLRSVADLTMDVLVRALEHSKPGAASTAAPIPKEQPT